MKAPQLVSFCHQFGALFFVNKKTARRGKDETRRAISSKEVVQFARMER